MNDPLERAVDRAALAEAIKVAERRGYDVAAPLMAKVLAERDTLRAELAASEAECDRLRAALDRAEAERDALREIVGPSAAMVGQMLQDFDDPTFERDLDQIKNIDRHMAEIRSLRASLAAAEAESASKLKLCAWLEGDIDCCLCGAILVRGATSRPASCKVEHGKDEVRAPQDP